jgi:hypothetical protein
MISIIYEVVALAAPLSLHVQLDKCAVYSADTRAAASLAGQLGMRHAPDGLQPAGISVGTPAYQAAQADSCADRACSLMDDLEALPLADQDCWILLQSSLQWRVAHLPRGCQWTHVAAAVQRSDSKSLSISKAVDGVFAILGLPSAEGPPTAQITLSIRHGGLGLSHTCPAEGSAAYLSAAASIHQAMCNGPKPSGLLICQAENSFRSGHPSGHPCTAVPELCGYQEVSPSSLGTIAAG